MKTIHVVGTFLTSVIFCRVSVQRGSTADVDGAVELDKNTTFAYATTGKGYWVKMFDTILRR